MSDDGVDEQMLSRQNTFKFAARAQIYGAIKTKTSSNAV